MHNAKIVSCCLFSLMAASALAVVKITPILYNINIVTKEKDFQDPVGSEKLTFSGTVDIHFKISKTSGEKNFDIVLNTHAESVIKDLKLKGLEGNSSNEIKSVTYEQKGDRIFIKCSESALAYENFLLTIIYINPYENDMTGFYRSSYKDAATNKTRWLLTTHFEPIFARKAFPCFDQPDLKAYFNIELTVPNNIKTVLCNTPVIKKEKSDGTNSVYTCKKHQTPMSTYLVAFTASELESTEPNYFLSNYPQDYLEKRTLKTYGRPEIIRNGEGKLAQAAGKEALDHLSEYLGIGYALEKVDQVGVPDFSAGAMENWGHISFREKSLFFNDATGSTTTKQANVLTITHELVHQWFGNLVTLESWNYIWLNEAFANYLEYVIASKCKNPNTAEWNLMNQLVVNEIHARAFETDGLNSSKPLNNNITDEKLIYSSFNDIPYAKGASVLRMWNKVLKDNFQKSLNEYINDRKGLSANPSQLFEFFKKNGMNEKFFKTWTEQEGYPVVEVKKQNKNEYTLIQSRFFWEKLASNNSVWYIPISFSTSKSPKFDSEFTFMESDTLNITAEGDWIIVNNQQAGYFRVNYEKQNWDALSAVLQKNDSAFPEVNRAQIVNDVFSLARSLQKNYVEYSTALNLAKYLEKEKSLIVWKTALNAFDFLQTKLHKMDVEAKFKQYVLDLIKPHFKSLNNKNLTHTDKLKNIEISRWACALQYEPCIKEAKSIVKSDSYGTHPDTQETILCTEIRNDKNLWQKIFDKYLKEEDSALKLVYLMALGCTTDSTKIEEFLNKSLEGNSGIRKQDLVYVMSSVYNGNLMNVDIAFNFLEKNFEKIAKQYAGINPLGKVLVGIAKKLNTKNDFARLKTLAEKIRKLEALKGSEESIQNALQIAESNYIWVSEKEAQFKNYFKGSGSIITYSLTLLSLSFAFVFQF